MRRLFALCLLPLLLNGCAGALLSTGTQAGMAVAENRSLGRKLDDTVIYTDLTNQFIQADQAALLSKVTFNVRYARVMLTGNVKSEEDAAKAVALSWKAKGVTEVINELNIKPDSSILDTAGDAVVKRNLEARLLITKGVWVINYSIDVTNGTAYLIGRVKDQAELDRALNVARTTKGVKRVVSHLQINSDTMHPTASPDGGDVDHNQSFDAPDSAPSSASSAPSHGSASGGSSGGSDIYTGPVYGGGSISSAPVDAPKAAAKEPVSGGY
jgi:osmotically-inducible protein OsmY